MKKRKRLHPEDIDLIKSAVVQEMENLIKDCIYKKWIKSSEVCKILDISQAKLHDLRTNKEIPYSTIGKQHYYKLEDIHTILENNRVNKLVLS